MGNKNTRSEYRKKSRRMSTTTNISVDTVLDQSHFHAGKESKENPFEKYIYPFENVIFEASKEHRLLAYCGAVRVRALFFLKFSMSPSILHRSRSAFFHKDKVFP